MDQKKENKNLTGTFLLIIALLFLGALVYIFLIQNSTPSESSNDVADGPRERAIEDNFTGGLDENDKRAGEKVIPSETTPQEIISDNEDKDDMETPEDFSKEIDKDISSLDELDLSSQENDLGDNQLSDL